MSGGGEVRTACAVDVLDVVRVAGSTRCSLHAEQMIQAELEAEFRADPRVGGRGVVSREHVLGPADRPDFLIGGAIVVECKGKRHREPAVLAQLRRYAAYPEVSAIVLATARAMRMPAEIRSKPVFVVNLGRAWL